MLYIVYLKKLNYTHYYFDCDSIELLLDRFNASLKFELWNILQFIFSFFDWKGIIHFLSSPSKQNYGLFSRLSGSSERQVDTASFTFSSFFNVVWEFYIRRSLDGGVEVGLGKIRKIVILDKSVVSAGWGARIARSQLKRRKKVDHI